MHKAYSDGDFVPALVAYKFFYPAVSMKALTHGTRTAGVRDNEAFTVLDTTPGTTPTPIRRDWIEVGPPESDPRTRG